MGVQAGKQTLAFEALLLDVLEDSSIWPTDIATVASVMRWPFSGVLLLTSCRQYGDVSTEAIWGDSIFLTGGYFMIYFFVQVPTTPNLLLSGSSGTLESCGAASSTGCHWHLKHCACPPWLLWSLLSSWTSLWSHAFSHILPPSRVEHRRHVCLGSHLAESAPTTWFFSTRSSWKNDEGSRSWDHSHECHQHHCLPDRRHHRPAITAILQPFHWSWHRLHFLPPADLLPCLVLHRSEAD